MSEVLKYSMSWLVKILFSLIAIFIFQFGVTASASPIIFESGHHTGISKIYTSAEIENLVWEEVDRTTGLSRVLSEKEVRPDHEVLVRESSVAAKGVSNLAIRPDIIIRGGRSGQMLKNATGPANAVVKGGVEGRVLITNHKGQVIWDITKERAKSVIPGQGFGPKVKPTEEQLNLIKQIWGN